MIGTIHDIPTPLPTMNNACLPLLTQMNQAWWHNAMMFGYFCLAAGFLIGVAAGYVACKRYYGI